MTVVRYSVAAPQTRTTVSGFALEAARPHKQIAGANAGWPSQFRFRG